MPRKFDEAAVERFLDTLASTQEVTKAARAAGVSTVTVYAYRERDPVFRAAWVAALDAADHVLRRVALRRIHEGFEQPVYYRGRKIDTLRKYNDALLINLIKLETARRERREAREAAQALPPRDALSEILELIDGNTRRIHERQ
mgnify:CR=1 FL=1